MDVLSAIKERRSVRKYLSKPVEFDKITAVVEAATYAPSAGNLQDWHFVIVTEKSLRESIAEHCMEQYWMLKAPVMIVVCNNQERSEIRFGLRGKRLYSVQDAAAATENMLLAAKALGLGTCWVGAFDEEFIIDLLGIPGKARPQAIVTLGYPDEKPEEKDLLDLVDLVSFNKYGKSVLKPHLVLKDYSVEIENQIKKSKPVLEQGVSKIKESVQKLKEQVNK